MEKYSIDDILQFFQRQMHDEFRVIEAIVNLIEYDNDEMDKHEVIIDTLRRYGLFEEGYEGPRNFIDKSRSAIVEEFDDDSPEASFEWIKDEAMIPIELYNITLLNRTVMFQNFLN